MSKNVIAQLEVHRDNLINNIKVRGNIIKALKAELLEELQGQVERREALKEVEEAIEKLRAE
ncbi:TPA: hypothetical protein NNV62_003704 [Salmonella enterica]|nr:hypothetical protein [Salmonella enterica]